MDWWYCFGVNAYSGANTDRDTGGLGETSINSQAGHGGGGVPVGEGDIHIRAVTSGIGSPDAGADGRNDIMSEHSKR